MAVTTNKATLIKKNRKQLVQSDRSVRKYRLDGTVPRLILNCGIAVLLVLNGAAAFGQSDLQTEGETFLALNFDLYADVETDDSDNQNSINRQKYNVSSTIPQRNNAGSPSKISPDEAERQAELRKSMILNLDSPRSATATRPKVFSTESQNSTIPTTIPNERRSVASDSNLTGSASNGTTATRREISPTIPKSSADRRYPSRSNAGGYQSIGNGGNVYSGGSNAAAAAASPSSTSPLSGSATIPNANRRRSESFQPPRIQTSSQVIVVPDAATTSRTAAGSATNNSSPAVGSLANIVANPSTNPQTPPNIAVPSTSLAETNRQNSTDAANRSVPARANSRSGFVSASDPTTGVPNSNARFQNFGRSSDSPQPQYSGPTQPRYSAQPQYSSRQPIPSNNNPSRLAPVESSERIVSSPNPVPQQNSVYAQNSTQPQNRYATPSPNPRYSQNEAASPQKGESLSQAIELALSVSRQLQAKANETRKAEANVEAAKGIRRPKISNASAYTAMSDPLKIESNIDLSGLTSQLPIPLPSSVAVETPVSDRNFATSVTSIVVPLYLGGKAQGMLESANALADAMAAGEKIGELDLKYEVVQTYLLVLRARKLLNVAQDAEVTLQAHEADAERLLANGIVAKNVVLAAQVARAEATQNVLKVQNGVRLAEAAYNRLLWRSLQTPVEIVDQEIPPTSGDLESLTARAVRNRPELAALDSQQKAVSAQEKVHRADRLPQIAAVGSHAYVQNSYLNPNSNFTGSVGLAWTPFDGGISRAREEASQFEALAVSKLKEDAQTGIELQVYQCWLDEQETRQRVAVAEIAVEQANENLRVVTRSFNEGLVNHTEVLDAQTLKTQAATNLAHAKYDAILATWKLLRAVGNL